VTETAWSVVCINTVINVLFIWRQLPVRIGRITKTRLLYRLLLLSHVHYVANVNLIYENMMMMMMMMMMMIMVMKIMKIIVKM